MAAPEQKMRVVFMGTPDFAATVLRHVAAWPGCEVAAAYCQPDRPAGRGHKLQPPAVKVLAQELGIPVFQPLNFKDEADRRRARRAPPRRAGRRRLRPHSAPIRAGHPDHRPFNVHGSLLPQYRGAAPIQRAIMDGNHLTGITIMRMERGLDTGPMLLQRALGIGIDDTAATMHDELADLGGRLMVEVLRQYADGDPSTPIPQEEALATYAAKLTKADGHIDWDEDAAVIHARIRGVTPWPGAQTVFLLPGRDPLPALLQPGRVGETFTGGHPAPGTLVALRDGKLLIACRDALYEVSTLKPAGGKPMSAEAFWNGYCRAANKDGCGRAVSPSLG